MTHRKRLNRRKLLHNRLLLRKIRSPNSQRRRRDNRQTNRDANDHELQRVEQQCLLPRRRNGDIPIEAANPHSQYPRHHQHQKRRPDTIHHHFEMAGVLCVLHHRGCSPNECPRSSRLHHRVCFSAFTSGCVENGVSDVAVHGERFPCDCGMVAGYD